MLIRPDFHEFDRVTESLKIDIETSYVIAGSKGATMPDRKNIKNLPETIYSIPTGGGGDAETAIVSENGLTIDPMGNKVYDKIYTYVGSDPLGINEDRIQFEDMPGSGHGEEYVIIAKKLTGNVDELSIPFVYNDKVVVEIAADFIKVSSLSSRTINKLTIPGSILYIRQNAFKHPAGTVKELTIQNGVRNIGYAAFDRARITELTIPASVKTIEEYAFNNTNLLKTIAIEEGEHTLELGNSAFRIASIAGVVSRDNIVLPARLTEIGAYCFENNRIDTIQLKSEVPPVLANINAFTHIGKFVVPDGFGNDYKTATNWSSFADKIFEESEITQMAKLDNIEITENGTYNPVAPTNGYKSVIVNVPTGEASLEIEIVGATPTGSKAILTQDGNGTLKAVIPEGVEDTGLVNNFQKFRLKSLVLPSTLKMINSYTFRDNMHLESVMLPNSLKTMYTNAFESCGLKSIIIPESITTMSNGVFNNNNIEYVEWNTSITIPAKTFGGLLLNILNPIKTFIIPSENVVALSNVDAFNSKSVTSANPMTVYVPASLITSYQTATNWSSLYSAGRVIFEDIINKP